MLRVVTNPDGSTLAVPPLNQRRIARHWRGWLMLGLTTILLAVAALTLALGPRPPTAALLGMILLADGLSQALHSHFMPRWRGSGLRLLGAVASVATGGVLLSIPLDGVLSPVLLLGVFLVLTGLGKIFLAGVLEPLRGWYWMFAVGMVTISLGLGLLMLPPEASAAVLALLLGLALGLDGGWTLHSALSARPRTPSGQRTTATSGGVHR